MITYKDCPECGANKIHSSVRLCETCEKYEKYESKLAEALRERDAACEELEVLRGLIEGEPWAGAVLRRERDEARSVLREFFDASKNSVPYAQWPREMHEAARVLGDK